jgi:Glycosyl hydrolase catalytic core
MLPISGSWLEQFMDRAKARGGYRIDLICVHLVWRGFDIDGAVNRLKNFLQAVHHKFQLPIGSRNSLIRWSNSPIYPSCEQQAKFASRSIEMFEVIP